MVRFLKTKIARGEPLLASDILDLTFFPVGMIMMMDGSWQDGRGGWYICDGQNGTPDLRDKFIKAKGTKPDIGDGKMTLSINHLPVHNHTLTIESAGQHTHSAWADVNRYEGWIWHQSGSERYGGYTDTKPAGEHDHAGSSVGNTGSGQSFDMLPSYYSVIYIKKMTGNNT